MVRIAVVDREKCNPLKCGHLCAKLCPINRTGSDCIVVEEKAQIDEVLCTGCGICQKRCPFGAIAIINLPETLKVDPIHKHGKNGFQLFSLPTPIKGKILGVIGKNGIGKSTAIKILADVLKPNFGNPENKFSYDQLVDYFKGTEAQTFFENVREGKVKVSFKPQEIELIPKNFDGTVEELLKKVDEKGEVEEVMKKLGIEKIKQRSIKNVSGGELQRTAIAACVLKKANLYILDEPNSYLDIKQRIKLSKFLRELVGEENSIIMIEHDLIILDYIADMVQIMYGRAGAYGIVSQPKTTKAGINTYLEGYLKEENIRFRDKKIEFFTKAEPHESDRKTLASWKGLKKKLGDFNIKADEGEIKKNETVGVLGENGIGKTSFVKMLAGDITPDEGKIDEKTKISYKPQYLDSDSEETVYDVLKEAITKYTNQIIKPFNIEPLFEKKMSQLSGGELQKVMIAKCLSEDAELHLLDEPSAYLDVEQRLALSKIMRDFIDLKGRSALVVDHDLLFVDYLSDKIMAFKGTPATAGHAEGPFTMGEGMNLFLRDLNLTFRRDEENNRPRANKEDSQNDRKQKAENKLYYHK